MLIDEEEFEKRKNYTSERLKNIREELRFTISGFASEFGLEYRTYKSYEFGERRIPITLLNKIARRFNVDVNYFFFDDAPMFIQETKENNKKETRTEDLLLKVIKGDFETYKLLMSVLKVLAKVHNFDEV